MPKYFFSTSFHLNCLKIRVSDPGDVDLVDSDPDQTLEKKNTGSGSDFQKVTRIRIGPNKIRV